MDAAFAESKVKKHLSPNFNLRCLKLLTRIKCISNHDHDLDSLHTETKMDKTKVKADTK